MHKRFTHIMAVFFIAVCILIFSLFFGCVSQEEPDPDPVINEEPETVIVEESEQVIDEEVVEENLPEPETEAPQDDFVPTEEEYNQTFTEVESLIELLNEIIARQEYNTWLQHLTDEYIEHFSDTDVLRDISTQLQKRGYNINLLSLKDYFKYIVVGSRADVQLDEIEFLDESLVTAISVIDGTSYILYYLQKIDDEWKIGFWD